MYNLGSACALRCKCTFRQTIPPKPRVKYRIKLWLMTDALGACVCAAEIYTGKYSDVEKMKYEGKNVVRS